MSDTIAGETGSKLFPSQSSKLVFVSYMLMFVAQVNTVLSLDNTDHVTSNTVLSLDNTDHVT